MKIVGYARVSSKEQQLHTNALDQQIKRLENAGAEKVFVDVESGYKGKKRPALDQIMTLVRTNQIETLMITRVDRLSRRSKEAFALIDEFIKSQVSLKVLDEPIDLSSAAGKLSAGMVILMAQHHSDQKSEMIKHGWNHFRAQQKATIPPFGYTKKCDRYILNTTPLLCLLINHEEKTESEIAAEIIDTYIHERSLRNTLRIINEKYGLQTFSYESPGRFLQKRFLHSAAGLAKWLHNPVLRGHTCYKTKEGEQIIENTHTQHRLLDDIQWYTVRNIKDKNSETRGYGSSHQKYPISGLVYCGYCRAAMYSCTAQHNRKGSIKTYTYYQCKNWDYRSCQHKKMIATTVLEEALLTKLVEYRHQIVNDLMSTEFKPVSEPPEVVDLRNQLEALLAIKSSQPSILAAVENIRAQIATILSTRVKDVTTDMLKESLVDIFSDISLIQELPDEQLRLIYTNFVDKIFVKDGKVENIILRF